MSPRKDAVKRVRRLRERIRLHMSVLERLRDTGGFTVNTTTMKYVTKGFAVSVNPERNRQVHGPIDIVTLATYERDNRDMWGEGKVFGAWLDTETGITHLDVVTVLDSKELALDLAVQHGELAIYDLGSGQEIRTGVVR